MADVPDEPVPEPGRARPSATRYEVAADRPTRAVLLSGLPLILLVLVVVYLFATFFPALGALMLIVIPVAVIAALVAGAIRTRRITLVVTDEVVRITNGKAGTACLRSDIHTAVVVERFLPPAAGSADDQPDPAGRAGTNAADVGWVAVAG